MARLCRFLLWAFAVSVSSAQCLDGDLLHVGMQDDGRIIVPTNQVLKPAGIQVTFPGRPVDLLSVDHDNLLLVKNDEALLLVDVATHQIKQTLKWRDGLGVFGLAEQGGRVYVSDTEKGLRCAVSSKNGVYQWERTISMPAPKVGGDSHPAGIALQSPSELWCTSTRGNSVSLIDLDKSEIKETVSVGIAPFTVCSFSTDKCYVSNWGGDPPRKEDPQAGTSGSKVHADPRTSVADEGSVSVLKRIDGVWKQTQSIRTGLHPCGMVLSPMRHFLYVANANSDSVSVIDTHTDTITETINCKPENRLPFGSGTNALAISTDGKTLFAADGTNNCIAVIELGAKATDAVEGPRPDQSRVLGLIPTGWFPCAVVASQDSKRLFVANIKGHGALSQPRALAKGKNTHDHLGSVSIIDIPDAAQLAKYTQEVNENNRLAYSLSCLDAARAQAAPLTVPERHGEPSLIKHVIYVIKENRTYDQVFGDMQEGNGDPKLAIFGQSVTPNQHALAREFTLFDNFYCSGVRSADGHLWATEAYVTDYLERCIGGGLARGDPSEDEDALAYAPTGFIWDNAVAHGKSVSNFGELVKTTYNVGEVSWTDCYKEFKTGAGRITFSSKAALKSMEPYTAPNYPGWALTVPDVYRAKVFNEALKKFEQAGTLPNLVVVYLPNNHTCGLSAGMPVPKSMVADNDLALGQIVESLTKSKFWPDTCIFVVEDDPQNGYDHVDGHRTVALAISPYTRRHYVDHTNYNQTGMVKTIELILGLPPMNQLDLSATPMRSCFQATPDLNPFSAIPNTVALDEMNKRADQLQGKALEWSRKSMALSFSEPDQADEDTLNRVLWFATRGDAPYPEEFVKADEDGDE